ACVRPASSSSSSLLALHRTGVCGAAPTVPTLTSHGAGLSTSECSLLQEERVAPCGLVDRAVIKELISVDRLNQQHPTRSKTDHHTPRPPLTPLHHDPVCRGEKLSMFEEARSPPSSSYPLPVPGQRARTTPRKVRRRRALPSPTSAAPSRNCEAHPGRPPPGSASVRFSDARDGARVANLDPKANNRSVCSVVSGFPIRQDRVHSSGVSHETRPSLPSADVRRSRKLA
ncbi:hypothetical protein BD310DRAFT_775087, partial [Dichomitus squalens]